MARNLAIDFFRYGVGLLLENLPEEFRGRINGKVKVGYQASDIANAVTSLRSFRFLGYEIKVNQGWYQFISDAAALYVSRSQVLSPVDHRTLIPVATNVQEIASILKQITKSYLATKRWTPATPLLNAISKPVPTILKIKHPSQGKIFSFLRFYICYFTMAHELGHIIAGHVCTPYPDNQDERWEEEYEADRIALRLMLNILARREDLNTFSSYVIDGVYVSAEDQMLVMALNSFSLMLALIDLWQQAAEALRKTGWQTHPPGNIRYLKLRDYCIGSNLIAQTLDFNVAQVRPESLFDIDLTGLSSPDDVQHTFQYIALDILWLTDDRIEAPDPEGGTSESLLVTVKALLEEVWAHIGDLAEAQRQRLEHFRRRLDVELRKDQSDINMRIILAQLLATLCLAFIFLGDYKRASIYWAGVQHHLRVIHGDGLDTSAEQAKLRMVGVIIFTARLERTTVSIGDATNQLGEIYQLLQEPRQAVEQREKPSDEDAILRQRVTNNLAALVALSELTDDWDARFLFE